ncbi:DotU family type VI secretion system protein [Accumulibacter sp.]|uniref:DotU family type VI secretion system protein n=1 Tax=Accumulibacter sp. TaxID=2053492 RepID=UPI0025D983F7|nr:DotU family type VI secretion system protein [Accumulibacter sp.]MCM8614278.1 DotU family type VI secretion system protein [Accumulibacter sp.]MCM8638074.1 DotU family type VI secretion system protein [Accumulibacter sp.]MCM8641441.1 DotU family type VI secretion system protein [Accumulibacter sp.]
MVHDDPFLPPSDKTLLVPSPGARASRPATGSASEGAPAGSRFERIELSSLDWHTGLNPLVAAANPLLNLAPQLRQVNRADPGSLREALARAVSMFERQAKERGVLHEHVMAGRYALCTFLDEAAANTPWGEKIWAQRSLLVQFHNEAWGGEKFFQLMGKVAEQPSSHRDLLELFYLILSLGFEGRYRVLQNGQAQLASVRERLAQMLARERGEVSRELSPAWQSTAGATRPLRESLPLWAVAAVTTLLLALLYLLASFALNRHSDPTFSSILALKAGAPPAVASPQAPPAKAPARLAHFLTSDIQAGRVVVRDLPDRSIVLAQGDGLFEPGSATLSPTFTQLLARVGDAIRQVNGSVLIKGHTDNRPIRSARFPSNWHLSQARADAVAATLAPHLGERPGIRTEGRAESDPLMSNDTAEGRAQNRRVEIIVYPAVPGPDPNAAASTRGDR